MSFNSFSLNYVTLFEALCDDLDIPCRTRAYCLNRIKNEGIKFLVVTLPKLNDLVLRSLELGSLALVKQDFTAFRWRRNALVDFNKLLCDLYEKGGTVKLDPDVVTLWRIRQFSLYFYKLSLEFTDEQVADAEASFIEVEQQIASVELDNNFVDKMRKNIETFYKFPTISDVLSKCRPRSGPGTYSSKKGETPPCVEKLQRKFTNGFLSKFSGISGYFKEAPVFKNCLQENFLDTNDCSQVLFVPKDGRGPRVITREPLLALKLQMSFFDYFSRFFENATKSRINFTNQEVNRNLAREGSLHGTWATLDLKEASDRVSLRLVKTLSMNVPSLRYFLKSRTPVAELPNGRRVNLEKLAGMGSGLTFVWLALICHTAIATEISLHTGQTFAAAAKDVYVYGDDIIVRSCHVKNANSALKKVGLIVNVRKSFSNIRIGTSKCFRESCGGDFYAGNDVGITKLKMQGCGILIDRLTNRLVFNKPSTAIFVASSHAAEMSLNGYSEVSHYLYGMISKTCGKLPLSRYPTSYVSQVTRKYYSTSPDSFGNYGIVSVLCSKPRVLSNARISETVYYSRSLRSKVDPDLMNLKTSITSQFDVAVPHANELVRTRVSSFALAIR